MASGKLKDTVRSVVKCGAPRCAAELMPNARVEVVEVAWRHPWLADPTGVARLLCGFLAEHDA